jgi:radical SAM-linked protein
MVFSFSKEDSAVFHGHLSLIEIFSMSMARAGLNVLYTQGFNPLPKLEIVSPLSVGISAGAEIAAVDFSHEFSSNEFIQKMNAVLIEGIRINHAEIFRIPAGSKKHSLSSLLWGFGYAKFDCHEPNGEMAYVLASGEKAYREQCLSAGGTVFSLRRACVLAKNSAGDADSQPWVSYFNCMRRIHPQG